MAPIQEFGIVEAFHETSLRRRRRRSRPHPRLGPLGLDVEDAFVRGSLAGPGAAKVARHRSAGPEYRENVFVNRGPRVIKSLSNTKPAWRWVIRQQLAFVRVGYAL